MLHYYWPGMYGEIKSYCEQCTNCQTRKGPHQKVRSPLVPLPVTGPFDRVGVGLLRSLPHSKNGNKYIVLFTEYLSKYAIAEAIPDATAETVAKSFVQNGVLKFGAPLSLLPDRASNFLSEMVFKICHLCCTRKVNTTPFHPMTDGLTERLNKTLTTIISMYISSRHNDWDSFLYYALFAYNSSRQQSTRFFPYFLIFGREPNLPIDSALNFAPTRYQIDLDDYGSDMQRLLATSWRLARQNISKAQAVQANYYNRNVHEIHIKSGDLVYKYTPTNKVGQA